MTPKNYSDKQTVKQKDKWILLSKKITPRISKQLLALKNGHLNGNVKNNQKIVTTYKDIFNDFPDAVVGITDRNINSITSNAEHNSTQNSANDSLKLSYQI